MRNGILFSAIVSFASIAWAQVPATATGVCDELLDTQSNSGIGVLTRIFPLTPSTEDRVFTFYANAAGIPDGVRIFIDNTPIGGVVWFGNDCFYYGSGANSFTCIKGPMKWVGGIVDGVVEHEIIRNPDYPANELDASTGIPIGFPAEMIAPAVPTVPPSPWIPGGMLVAKIKVPKEACRLTFEFHANSNSATGWRAKMSCPDEECPLDVDVDQTQFCDKVSLATGSCGVVDAATIWKTPDGQEHHAPTYQTTQSGVHQVFVKFGNGCTLWDTFMVAILPQSLAASVTSPLCQGGQMQLGVELAGQFAQPTYQWTGPGGFTSNAASPTLANLSAAQTGTYHVTVKDLASGCTLSGSIQANVSTLAAAAQSASVRCDANGTAQAIGSGGKPPYSFAWSNGQTESTLTGLPQGPYAVTVTDADGCAADADTYVEDEALAISVESQPTWCHDDGTATVKATGGTGDYAYLWSNGATTAKAQGLAPGTYSVTVTDDAGCKRTKSVAVGDVRLTASASAIDRCRQLSDRALVTLKDKSGKTVAAQEAPLPAAPGIQAVHLVYEGCAYSTAAENADQGKIVVQIPNAFTPDGSGANDAFTPLAFNTDEKIEVRSFRIYDRWGQVVFEAENFNLGEKSWDGTVQRKDAPSDVYVYVFEYVIPGCAEVSRRHGDVTLIR